MNRLKDPCRVLFDCDPGLDDAIALLMVMAVPEQVQLLGITTVVGNASLNHIQVNARKICELTERSDVPVFGGCPRPLMRWTHYEEEHIEGEDENLSYVKHIHGDTGLGGRALPFPKHPLEEEHAVAFIVRMLREADTPVTVIATGPLTNIATAFLIAPDIVSKIDRIILMGGAVGIGNITPAAEYNFYVDPHAASVVFGMDVSIVMSPLDVTRKILAHADLLKKIKALPSSKACVIAGIIESRPKDHYEPGMTEGVLHDPTTVGYLLNPDIFQGQHAFVSIETEPGYNWARSAVDWSAAPSAANAFVLKDVNVEAFEKLMLDLLGRYPLSMAS